jgi:hypothetical protein
MRKLMVNFLWKGNRDTKHYHLCKWDHISLPKLYGGWGLRNIFDFKHALAANTLWRVLTSSGIWHRVIKDKYLPHTTIKNWFRSQSFQHKATSRIWGRATEINSFNQPLVELEPRIGSAHSTWGKIGFSEWGKIHFSH